MHSNRFRPQRHRAEELKGFQMQDFGIEFPIWTVAITFVDSAAAMPDTIIRVNDAEFGSCIQIFTCIELVDKFVEEATQEMEGEFHTALIQSPDVFVTVVNCLAQKGSQYIVVNCSLDDEGSPLTFIPVTSVLGKPSHNGN